MSFTDDIREPVRSVDPLDGFETFAGAVRGRLDQGRATYGDASFSAHPSVLLAELQAEALDLAGWGFVLWTRLEAMRAALGNVQQPETRPAPVRLVGADRARIGAEQ
jgi:hypothetical protein